jgi:chemotaxis family two-component system response regulator Rcp1
MRPIEILLVENNLVDVRLVQETFKDSRISNNVSLALDGEEAMDFLYRRGAYADAPKPDLIILDLSLPKKDGREVLEEIKGDDKLKAIPVIVLSTSDYDKDIVHAYANHACCYIVKPLEFDEFLQAMKSLRDFWLFFVRFPTK